jgi:transcriptional regulator with XRE-family HTH domain
MPKTIHSKGYIALIRRIRDRRIELGLTQSDLASRVGQHRSWIQRSEVGERRLDFLETVDLLRALRIKLDEAARIVMEKAP